MLRHPLGLLLLVGLARPAVAEDVPVHRDVFAAAWRDARACLVGAPQWDADLAHAHEIQIVRGVDDCSQPLGRARAIAHEAADADAGYHAAWTRVVAALAELESGSMQSEVPNVEESLTKVGIPTPAVELATIPTLSLANAKPVAGTQGVKLGKVTPPREHRIEIEIEGRDPLIYGAPPAKPTWTATSDDTDEHIRVGKVDLGPGWVLATVGDGAERAILGVVNKGDVVIIRSHDSGAHWDRPVPVMTRATDGVTDYATATKRAGAQGVDVMWSTSDGEVTVWQPIEGPKHDVVPKRTIPFNVRKSCVTGDVMFWIASGKLGVTDARGTRILRPLPHYYPELASCAAGRVVVADRDKLFRCDATRCDAALDASNALADLDASGNLHYISSDQSQTIYKIGQRLVRIPGKVLAVTATNTLLVATPTGLVEVTP